MMARGNVDFDRLYRKFRKHLLGYQRDGARDALWEFESGVRELCLAFGPGGGKTETAIAIALDMLARHPDLRVLVLAHGTSILRTNFADRLTRYDIPHGVYVPRGKPAHVPIDQMSSRIVVALPQGVVRLRKLPAFQLVIVDEAHERYGKDESAKILKRARPEHVLLLTGTPAKYIDRKLPLVAVSPSRLIDEKRIEDAVIEIAESAYGLSFRRDYNNEGNVKEGVRCRAKDTKVTMRSVVDGLARRLGGKDIAALDKTLVACRSIEQAIQVHRCFASLKVKALLSHSDDTREGFDEGSAHFVAFREDPSVKALVIVQRGILGFDMPELVNVVDMTNSFNPNRIFQLLCRGARVCPGSGVRKVFIKMAPVGLVEYTKAITSIVMQLAASDDFYRRWDGKLTGSLPVLVSASEAGAPWWEGVPENQTVPPPPTTPQGPTGRVPPVPPPVPTAPKLPRGQDGKVSPPVPPLPVPPPKPPKSSKFPSPKRISDALLIFDGWVPVVRDRSGSYAGCVWSTLGKARKYLLGVREQEGIDPGGKKRQLLDMARRGDNRPSTTSSLYSSLKGYIRKTTNVYDAAFDRQIHRIAPHWFVDKVTTHKKKLIAMARTGCKRPPRKPGWSHYVNKMDRNYDARFDREIRSLAPHWFRRTEEEHKRSLIEIAQLGAERPSRRTVLGYTLYRYARSDTTFNRQIHKLAPSWFMSKVLVKKNALLALARKGSNRPSQGSGLGCAVDSYTSATGHSFDPAFNAEIRSLAPKWFIRNPKERKRTLLAMARRGEDKPARASVLYRALGRYTNTGSDPAFNAEIRRLAPHWFKPKKRK